MREIIVTDHAPKPIGPYSQAVRANGFLFTAQIALDPNTNTFLEGDVAQQTERVLENLKAILTHAGLTLSHVVKTTVFLKDMNDLAAMNEVYAKYFPAAPRRVRPCRSPGYRETRWSRLNWSPGSELESITTIVGAHFTSS